MTDNGYRVTGVRHAAVSALTAALTFWAFFQISKLQVISEISPFAEDPVDAIGSFAFQIALVVGFLTFARSWRCRDDAASASKGRLVIRGCIVVLVSIAATLLADAITEFQHPTWDVSLWGKLLILGLGVVAVPVFLGGLATINGITWLSPRSHPWHFSLLAALAVGLALGLAPVVLEGMPPSLAIFIKVVLVFITGETAMAMLGFLLLGGYLGLRAPLWPRTRR